MGISGSRTGPPGYQQRSRTDNVGSSGFLVDPYHAFSILALDLDRAGGHDADRTGTDQTTGGTTDEPAEPADPPADPRAELTLRRTIAVLALLALTLVTSGALAAFGAR